MAELGVKADRAKVAVGWAAEKMGRLKPNAQLRGYSPLSPLVELEGLLVGIQGKLSLWRALAEVAAALGLDPARLQGLAARALSQQADVERHRLDVARKALTARLTRRPPTGTSHSRPEHAKIRTYAWGQYGEAEVVTA